MLYGEIHPSVILNATHTWYKNTYYLTLNKKAQQYFETSVTIYQSTGHNIPKDWNVQHKFACNNKSPAFKNRWSYTPTHSCDFKKGTRKTSRLQNAGVKGYKSCLKASQVPFIYNKYLLTPRPTSNCKTSYNLVTSLSQQRQTNKKYSLLHYL